MLVPYGEDSRNYYNDNSYGNTMKGDNMELKRLTNNIQDTNNDGIIDESDKVF